MQRVRVGLTGLACVFLLVCLAAAFFGLARPDPAGADGAGSTSADPLANTSVAEPREPLAEMGVTPGNVPADAKPTAVAAPPAAPVSLAKPLAIPAAR